jgi:dihydrofolate reductase
MAKLVFGMNQSLDGYVDHMAFAPSPTLFRHFIEEAQGQAGSVYGRQMYEVMGGVSALPEHLCFSVTRTPRGY